MKIVHNVTHWLNGHGTLVGGLAGGAVLTVIVLTLVWRAVRGTVKKWKPEDVITVVIALGATIYAGSGNWKFLGKAMHYGTDLKVVLVCVFEGAVVVEGIRARRNISEYGEAGKDGRGLWVLAALSSLLSVSESDTLQEALGRLVVPLLAAFLWERLMESKLDIEEAKKAAERRKARAELDDEPASRIRWRINPERIAVWLRLADATATSVTALETNRKVVAYLRATDRENREGRRLRWPWSAKARAERARTKLAAHALLHHGDPKAVHTALADLMLNKALKRLGVAEPAVQEESGSADAGPDSLDGPDSQLVLPAGSGTPNPDSDSDPLGDPDDGWDTLLAPAAESGGHQESGFDEEVRIPAPTASPDSVSVGAFEARTSDPDFLDSTSELGEQVQSFSPKPPPVAAVVRQVYRDDYDTATIQKIVAEIRPDARPDTITRTIKKIRTEVAEAAAQNPDSGTGMGGYL
jgi:hypothetical protein